MSSPHVTRNAHATHRHDTLNAYNTYQRAHTHTQLTHNSPHTACIVPTHVYPIHAYTKQLEWVKGGGCPGCHYWGVRHVSSFSSMPFALYQAFKLSMDALPIYIYLKLYPKYNHATEKPGFRGYHERGTNGPNPTSLASVQ